MINEFPLRLREIVALDEYLVRLQRSLSHKRRHFRRQAMPDAAYVTDALRARIVELRQVYRQEVDKLVLDIPIVQSALGVRGLWLMPLLRLVVQVDIVHAATPAALWRYCGLGVTGKMTDMIVSTQYPGSISFSTQARLLVKDLILPLLRHTSPYRAVYDEEHAKQVKRGVPRGIAYRRALRYTAKRFLKHLWLVWRRQEKLPLGTAYPGDETGLAAPFGWR